MKIGERNFSITFLILAAFSFPLWCVGVIAGFCTYAIASGFNFGYGYIPVHEEGHVINVLNEAITRDNEG